MRDWGRPPGLNTGVFWAARGDWMWLSIMTLPTCLVFPGETGVPDSLGLLRVICKDGRLWWGWEIVVGVGGLAPNFLAGGKERRNN